MTNNTPPDPAVLRELIERVEAASGPDRELDVLIELAVGENADAIQKLIDGSPHNTIDAIARTADREGGLMFFRVPRYTASLDAAMTLVPEGWTATIWWGHDGAGARLLDDRVHPERLPDADGDAATPALALCAASLRAHTSRTEMGEMINTPLSPTHEVEQIVAWLREQSDKGADVALGMNKGSTARAAYGGGSYALKLAADQIESGEWRTLHLGGEND